MSSTAPPMIPHCPQDSVPESVQLIQPFQISLLPNLSSLSFHHLSSQFILNPTELTVVSKSITFPSPHAVLAVFDHHHPPTPHHHPLTPTQLSDAHLFITFSEKAFPDPQCWSYLCSHGALCIGILSPALACPLGTAFCLFNFLQTVSSLRVGQ